MHTIYSNTQYKNESNKRGRCRSASRIRLLLEADADAHFSSTVIQVQQMHKYQEMHK